MRGVTEQSPYVSVREMVSVEKALLRAIMDSEQRIIAKMDKEHDALRRAVLAAESAHQTVHSDAAILADTRHRRVDDFIKGDEAAQARATGRGQAYHAIVDGLHLLNESRWLVVAIIAGLWLLYGGSVTVDAP